VENAAQTGAYLLGELRKMQAKSSHIVDVRGEGLMIGIELDGPVKAVRSRLVSEKHVFTGAASTNILRLLPPLCLSRMDADEALAKLSAVL